MARRLALIIGNSVYQDKTLARLKAPDADVGALYDVLKDSEVGGFDDVKLLINVTSTTVRRAISEFCSQKTRDDLLLLYFTGHGVLDDRGRLYLAVKDTNRNYLRASAIPAGFIADEMDNSRSQRQLLVLDCCHSGAFARGTKGAIGASVGTAAAFEGTGYGRVVLTATDATQYAWEGDQIVGEAQTSLYTYYLIEGLQTGAADKNFDGKITVDELYDYVYEQIVKQAPQQTPGKWSYKEQGEIIIALNKLKESRPGVAPPMPVPATEQKTPPAQTTEYGQPGVQPAAAPPTTNDKEELLSSSLGRRIPVAGGGIALLFLCLTLVVGAYIIPPILSGSPSPTLLEEGTIPADTPVEGGVSPTPPTLTPPPFTNLLVFQLGQDGDRSVLMLDTQYWEKYEAGTDLPGLYLRSDSIEAFGDFLEIHTDRRFEGEIDGTIKTGTWSLERDQLTLTLDEP
jgi:uncharacterized caspase-like protein